MVEEMKGIKKSSSERLYNGNEKNEALNLSHGTGYVLRGMSDLGFLSL